MARRRLLRTGRLARWSLATAAVLVPLVATAAHAEESASAGPVAEASYASGIGQVLGVLYPEDTLHVGTTAGTETHRTYLRFDLSSLPSDADEETLTVTIPIADDAGTRSPETAVIQGCAVPDSFADSGTDASMPEVDCQRAPEATFQDGDTPSFTLDVSSIVRDDMLDLALVPADDGTWHVGFDSRSRSGGNPATISVSYAEPEPAPPRTPPESPPPRTETSFDIPAPAPAPAFPNTPPNTTAGPIETEETSSNETVAAPPPLSTPVVGSLGFRYPAIFGLPLALLVAMGIAGDGLTRPVRVREAAK